MDTAWRKTALGKAEQAIVEAEIRLTALMMHLDDLRASGHDARSAEQLLDRMHGILSEMHGHRHTILLVGRGQFSIARDLGAIVD